MDTHIIKYPQSELEIFRYYYPDSLIGQTNGIDPQIQPEPDVHMDFTREDGIETCSCGLIYMDSPYQAYGHRNHRTGLPEPLFKFLSPDVYRRRGYEGLFEGYPNNTWVKCERCAMSVEYSNYVANGSAHDCWMEPFEQAHCSMDNSKRMIIDQSYHFKLGLDEEFSGEKVYLTLTPTLDGLKISTADQTHRKFLFEMLEKKTIALSEEELLNHLSLTPSPAMQQAFAKNEADRINFLLGSATNSNYRVSYGGGEGYLRLVEAGSALPIATRFSLSKEYFSRHCISSGVTVLRIPVIQPK